MAQGTGKDARLSEALARFNLASDAEAEQRAREQEDLRFVDFDQQWPDDVRAMRNGQQSGGGLPTTPARPCLTINKLRQPVEQVANEARNARLSLTFSPKGSGASQDVAEVFEDIARAIQADSRASLARSWAYERAIKCGRGYYRILTEYSNDGDWDQDIVYRRILNQAAVYMDPAATEPDQSDAEWAFVVEDIPWERYKRLYPRSKLAQGGDNPGVLEGIGDDQPEWVKSTEDGGHVIRVAEYFHVEHNPVTVGLFSLPDGSERTLPVDEAPEGAMPVIGPDGAPLTREIDRRTVKWCKLNAFEILEEQDWPGRYIPIIPVVATESNVNGERRWTGLVRPSMDAQRSYNYMRSAQVESVGLAPRAPFIGYATQFEGYEAWWQQANTRNFPYLPVNPARDSTGSMLPLPQRNVAEPAIQAITLAAHEADGDIKATTGRFDASLGSLNPSERSGKAILALQKQAEQSSSGWLDNLASMSMVYEGKVLRDLIPKVYGRPGRIVAAIGADEQRRSIMVGVPFVTQNGQPRPVPPGTPGAKAFDLTQGEYTVAVTIGKSFTTRREESVAMMGQLAEAAPQMVPLYADLWVGNMDFPGARQIADRLKKQLPPNLQDDGENGQPPIPPQIQQQMQQAQQIIDALTQELTAKTEMIERDTVKEQAETQRAAMDNETKLAIAARESQTQIELEKMKLEATLLQGQLEIRKAELAALQQSNLALMAQEHDAVMAAQQAESDRMLAADQAGYQQAAAEQQAAMAAREDLSQ